MTLLEGHDPASVPPPTTALSSSFPRRAPADSPSSPATAATAGPDARPRTAARASETVRSHRPRYSLLSKSLSAVPTLSTAQRFLPTYWLPTTSTMATTTSGANPTAADLLRQAMHNR